MPRPIVATIHLDALRHNLARVRACAPRAKVWAVVKADAYGHGLERALRGLAAADGLALVEFDGALRLRALGWRGPLLMLEGFFDARDLAAMAAHGLNGAVHCERQLALLEAARLSAPVDLHLKMNTGMNRLGFAPDRFGAAYARLRAIPAVREITLMTHFANADDADHVDHADDVGGAEGAGERSGARPSMREQLRRFGRAAADLPGPRSVANSAAVLRLAGVAGGDCGDWVRPGIMLYGGASGADPAGACGLRPAMTLRSELIAIQRIGAGEFVGYGSRFRSAAPMRIGVVACGYADGYPRHAPDGAPVLVDGVRTRLVGRVSMDMLTVDLAPVPAARVGSAVTLWGAGLPIDEVARAAGTIGYELMCALAPRVPVCEDGGAR